MMSKVQNCSQIDFKVSFFGLHISGLSNELSLAKYFAIALPRFYLVTITNELPRKVDLPPTSLIFKLIFIHSNKANGLTSEPFCGESLKKMTDKNKLDSFI